MLTLSKTDKTINDDNYDNKLHLSGELWVFYRGRFSQFFFKERENLLFLRDIYILLYLYGFCFYYIKL